MRTHNTEYDIRPQGQHSVLGLRCEPLPVVRIAIIGLGVRALRAVHRFANIAGVEVKALCDLFAENVQQAQNILLQHQLPQAQPFVGEEAWRQVCEVEGVDLLYICTDWQSHARIAVRGMECGKHVAVEVPLATTVEECWQIVDTAERMQRHCIMLENCCYEYFEMATLNMVQQGLLGDVIHAEGAYIHDLRERIFTNEHGKRNGDNWQTLFNATHTGNPYPTHGLGPVCQAMGIHRGDKLNFLVSMSTPQVGMSQYVQEVLGQQQDFALGDMNNTLIRTQKGRTILLQHNISSPRPYSRIHLLNGTRGFVQKYPGEQIALSPQAHSVLSETDKDSLLQAYTHPVWVKWGAVATEICGERARDYLMDFRLVHCLQKGLPLDMDVYDAAAWSCIVELSEKSVLLDSQPVAIPDFTRGEWQRYSQLHFAE